MLQYKIPQDVQIEDKILGPFTLKQLIMVAVGGGISYVTFLFVSKSYILHLFDYFWIAIPLLLSLAFAFLRINDVGFLKWLLLLYEFSHNSRRRRWDKAETARLHFSFVTAKSGEDSAKRKKEENELKKKAIPGKKNFSSLEELTQVLDHHNQFSTEEKTLSDEHEEDIALNLSADELARQRERLKKNIQNSAMTTQKEKISEVPTPTNSLPKTNTKPQNEVPVPSQHLSLADLQQGGSVSFS